MSNAARLPAVRSVADLQKIKTEAREKQEISVQRLGAISRKASTIREEAETVIRLCEKYQHFLVGLGPAVRLAMSCEARAAIRTVLGRIEAVCDEISGGERQSSIADDLQRLLFLLPALHWKTN